MAEPCALLGVEKTDHFHFCDGVELLHGMHASNVRPNQPRPTKPYAKQLPEQRVHRLLNAVVAHFFFETLVADRSTPGDVLTPAALETIDSALVRLDHSA
jgi:hypothetical protein